MGKGGTGRLLEKLADIVGVQVYHFCHIFQGNVLIVVSVDIFHDFQKISIVLAGRFFRLLLG